MFTGIIEAKGLVREVISMGTNRTYWIESPISEQLKVDQSVSHNGVCLTVEEVFEGKHRVTAIEETLRKSNLAGWEKNSPVNLERCLPINGRLDGHLVQGHIDTVAICTAKKKLEGSWEFRFKIEKQYENLVIEKGSICLNGISLTLFNVSKRQFSVAIIPYTYEHTNINTVLKYSPVNIEFDMVGKYINRHLENIRRKK